VSQEIEPESKQDVYTDDGDDSAPVKRGHEEREKKNADDQHEPWENEIRDLLPGRDGIDPFCPDLDAPIYSFLAPFRGC
jgi:hypothetical protein